MNDRSVHPTLTALVGVLGLRLPAQTGHLDAGFARTLAIWMLEISAPWPVEIISLMGELVALHRRDTSGLPPDPAEWQQVRRKILHFGDGQPGLLQRLLVVAEAAAWPIAAGRAALTELFKAVAAVQAFRASLATGWTQEDEDRAVSLLKELAAGNGRTPPAREEIPTLFAKAAPELERRFLCQLEASNNAFGQFRQSVINRIDHDGT